MLHAGALQGLDTAVLWAEGELGISSCNYSGTQPFGAAGGRRTITEQDGRGSASLLAAFLFCPLYIQEQICLYLLCVIGTFCSGTEKQDEYRGSWVLYR